MKLKEISKGIGLTSMTWVVVVGILWLANHGSLAILPRQMAMLVRLLMAVAFVASAAYGLYRAFICPVIYFVKAWRRGERTFVALSAVLCLLVAASLVELCHWSRVPEYDSVSPDGRYKIVAYVTNLDLGYFIPGGPGDGGSHPAKVELVEVSSGRVIATGRVDWLMNVADTQWWTNEVRVSRGDGGVTFALPEEGSEVKAKGFNTEIK